MSKIYTLIITTCLMLFASCDAHMEYPDTSTQPGHILCTDGKVLSVSDYEKSDKQAIAVVFYINHDENVEGTGYAVYLWDIEPKMFADSLSVQQGTSTDTNALDGNTNTFAMFGTKDVGSPLADAVFDIWQFGQSAYIPSVAQMRMLYAARNSINPIIEKCGGTPIPSEMPYCWYWTSTEVSGQQTAKAWLYSMGSGAIQETPKTQAHKARPIITLNQ